MHISSLSLIKTDSEHKTLKSQNPEALQLLFCEDTNLTPAQIKNIPGFRRNVHKK